MGCPYCTELSVLGGAKMASPTSSTLGDSPLLWQDPSQIKAGTPPGYWSDYDSPIKTAGIGLGTLAVLYGLGYYLYRKK